MNRDQDGWIRLPVSDASRHHGQGVTCGEIKKEWELGEDVEKKEGK